MAKERKEEEIKTDGWKDTFSDLMNLLLCFFVLLYSMSNVDEVKYAELVASLSNSFSVFNGGAQAIGEGTLISSGATQLSNLDDYYTDMGKAAESEQETDPEKQYEQKKLAEKQQVAEELYSEVVDKTETNRLQDSLDVTMDDGYNYVMLSLSGGVLFESGSAEIQPGAKQILSRVGTILKSYSNRRIKIEGHTDNVPVSARSKYESNDVLSMYRALSVADYIRSNTSLDPAHIKSSGRGDYDPVADNSTVDGRARNRRVEIKVYNSYNSDF